MNLSSIYAGAYKPAFDYVSQVGNGTSTVTNVTGAGFLSEITGRAVANGTTGTVTLSVTVDGQTAATIQLFSAGAFTAQGRTFVSSSTSDQARIALSIPFSASLAISITGASLFDGTFDVSVTRGVKI